MSTRTTVVTAVLLLCALATPVLDAQSANPFRGKRLYVDPNSSALKQAASWQRSRPADAAALRRIGEQPQAMWLGDWNRDVRRDTEAIMKRVQAAGALPVLVAYNIPYRDCGSYSRGGSDGATAYRRWILELARGIGRGPAVVILEPDAIAGLDCLPARLRDERYVLLQEAVDVLQRSGASVYVDAGHANWKSAEDMADRLRKAGIAKATGFALNVSNYNSTPVNITYGNRLSRLVGNKHYVIDTSRNGRNNASQREWCNVRNQALGYSPTTSTGSALVDAYLWVKTPGQSDGTCNGGPRAGEWWVDYALELSKAAAVIGSMAPR